MMFENVDEMIAHVEKEIPEDAEELKNARDIILVVAVNKKLRAKLKVAKERIKVLYEACRSAHSMVFGMGATPPSPERIQEVYTILNQAVGPPECGSCGKADIAEEKS